ncbi:ComF family protein [Psychrobacter sp. 16-MNA-CIBAN-0192]|uniref:ComF family protein n=1 Tax=Psychrobacter sp. 16-MNA-CIBAN-0192 TaxID=3140448 RepID=UPI003328508E
MRRLAPYQSGLWLAEYVNKRCQLCRVAASVLQPQPKEDSFASSSAPHIFSSLSQHLNSGLLCADCHHNIAWLPEPFSVDIAADTSLSVQAASYYDYPLRQAIHGFKHQEDMTKLPLLVHVLRQLPRPNGCHTDNSVIVAMPTTSSRLRARGFDPVTILSAYLSKHWRIPIWHGVQRIDETVSQRGLGRAERLTNLTDAFCVIEPPPVKRLLLFDDVATTGASLQALAGTLLPSSSININIPRTQTLDPLPTSYQISAFALAHGSQRLHK